MFFWCLTNLKRSSPQPVLKPSQRGHISHTKPKPHSAIWRMQIQPKPQTKWIVLKCISRWIMMNEVQNTYKEIFIFKRNQCIRSPQKTGLGMGKLWKGRLSLSTTEILHTQMNAFHPQNIKHFFLKASIILVSLRIAEARHVNHLLRVTQYNMVLSAL